MTILVLRKLCEVYEIFLRDPSYQISNQKIYCICALEIDLPIESEIQL